MTTYAVPTITPEKAWAKWYADYEVQFKRIRNVSGELIDVAEDWLNAEMDAFSKMELKNDHFIFRLKPIIINGFEVEPPLTRDECILLKELNQSSYVLRIGYTDYHWEKSNSHAQASKALRSFFGE